MAKSIQSIGRIMKASLEVGWAFLALETGTMIMNDVSSLQTWISKIQSWVELEGRWMEKELQKIPRIKPHPSSVNFLLIEGEMSLTDLREKLAHQKKILLRDCRTFKGLGDHWLRIGLKERSENSRIIKSLKNLID